MSSTINQENDNMRKAILITIYLFVLTITTTAQIKVLHRAEEVTGSEQIPSYDYSKNFLGSSNVRSYIGQILFVKERPENVRGYGYANFRKEKESGPIDKKARYGKAAPKNNFNSKYEDLVGKYFIVIDVQPDSRQHISTYEHIWWFLLENKDKPSDKVWYEYNERFSRTYPFITMSHYDYVNTLDGIRFIAPYKIESDGTITCAYLSDIDLITGKKINFSKDDIWTSQGATLEDKEYELVFLVQNQRGETSAFCTNDYSEKGPIDGKMQMVTETYYNELVAKYGEENIDKARRSVVTIGMPEDCVILSWGYPDEINKSASGDQWVYDNQCVYITNGIVTFWN